MPTPFTQQLKLRPSPMRVILNEGGFGEAVCQCGHRFPWDTQTHENMMYDGEGHLRIICPQCHAIE
jgi:hypothetical protein